jgi:RNA polymerase sigma-70 factor (ECF subfamily)
VARLTAGDPETEQHFATYFRTLLVLKASRRLRSRERVDDAVQETFARVLAALKRGSLKNPEGLGAFVHAVCENVLLEQYRAGARTTALEDGDDRPDDRVASMESLIAAGDERVRVRQALASLPQKERDLLRWLFFEEREKDDVCAALNVTRSHLRVLLHRAKARFRTRLMEL